MSLDIELVGRDAPLGVIRAALGRLQSGHGGLILIRGEPGIGKSALALRAAHDASEGGARVISGRAWELSEAPPYFPLWPMLRDLGISPPGSGDADAFGLWERVLEALAAACEEQPRVWVIEDVHAADLLSLDLLTFLAGPLGSLRALVVLTARAEDPRITARASQRLTRMLRAGIEVALEPLGAAQIDTLAARVASRPLSRAALASLAERTGGNPLFVIECARAFQSHGSVAPLPQTVRQVILERVALLPEATRKALGACAVLGRDVTAASVAKVMGVLAAKLIDWLQPALEAGILREVRPGHFSFSHILLRDAIEDSLAPSERHELHASAEGVLALLGDAPEVLVERARHALAALEPNGAGLALAERAAQLLEELGAFDRAYAMHQRRIEAERGVLGSSPPALYRLHVARVAQAAGRHHDARALCSDVIAQATADGDAELLARAALALGAELRPGAVDRELVNALERAHVGLSGKSATLACRVLARLAAALQPAPDPAVPVALAMRAIDSARASADASVLIEVLHVAGAALVDSAPIALRRQTQEELLELALAHSDKPRALTALTRLAMDQAEQGDFDAWDASVDRALELAAELGHPRYRWRALLLGSMRAVARGEVAESERLLIEVRELAALTDDPALALSLVAHGGERARLLHLDAELQAYEALQHHMDDVPYADVVFHLVRAASFARLDDREQVRAELAQLPKLTVALPGVWDVWRAEAHVLLGDVDACRRLRDTFVARSSPHLVGGHVPLIYEGPKARLLALFDSSLGDLDSSERKLKQALALVEARGLHAWVAQIRYDLGQVLTRAGRQPEAETLFGQSAELAEKLGMSGLSLRARRAGEQLGAGASVAAPIVPLTPTLSAAPLRFVREGDLWRVEYAGRLVRVKSTRGMLLIARLLDRPGEDIHVLALASDEAGASLHDASGAAALGLDARARRDYKERLSELSAETADAERCADLARLERLEREREALESELGRAFGMGGAARSSGSPAERARVNAQRRIKDAISRVAASDEVIGRYLEKAIITGTYCRFLA